MLFDMLAAESEVAQRAIAERVVAIISIEEVQ
jgi:hypothetical protein